MSTLDLSRKICSECGKKHYERKNIVGFWDHPWADYPCVFLLNAVPLWICTNCKNVASVKGDSENLDCVIEDSIREQTSQFIEIIKAKGQISSERVAQIIGISPSYLASLHQKKKTPSFNLWNELKAIAISPEEMIKRLDPSWDLLKGKLLLRA